MREEFSVERTSVTILNTLSTKLSLDDTFWIMHGDTLSALTPTLYRTLSATLWRMIDETLDETLSAALYETLNDAISVTQVKQDI